VLASPYYFVRMRRRGNWKAGFGQRFGRYDAKFKQSITNRQVFWLHAVSVGEVNVCTRIIRALEPRMPNLKIIVSTTTTTGMGELLKRLPPHIGKVYYPIDHRYCVTRALKTLRPVAIMLVEAEIWPNFLWRARKMGIPLFLANTRLSQKSFRGYKRFAFLFRRLFASFAGVGAQNETDADRLRQLGCRPNAIHVFGNLKFDAARPDAGRSLDVPALLKQLGVDADAPLLVAGSTHDGEEEILAEQFLRLRARFPKLFLILVPRHFERSREIGERLLKRGLKLFYRTDLNPTIHQPPGPTECLLVNTTGELMHFYQHASVVFVGKSITAKGGQNPIEPAALGKATVFGPNMQNFTDVVRILLAGDGAIQVPDAASLEKTFDELLGDNARREQLGANALKVVQANLGAVEHTVDMIVQELDQTGFYIVPKK